MKPQKRPRQVRLWSPAKINLFLHVVGRRSDGYHDLQSLMQMIDMGDELQLEDRPEGIELRVEGGAVPADESNLVYRAAELLKRELGISQGVRIGLKKSIPVSAGLGGGSSNAAATLLGLTRLWSLPLSLGQLLRFGEQLGADVPFFFQGPLAFAQGKGERLVPLQSSESWWLLLVNPGISVSTAWAYEAYDRLTTHTLAHSKSETVKPDWLKYWLTRIEDQIKINNFERPIISCQELLGSLQNDLETVVIEHHPVIQEIKGILMSQGAQQALMSGSGATVFGVFTDQEEMRVARTALQKEREWGLWETRTLLQSPWQDWINEMRA